MSARGFLAVILLAAGCQDAWAYASNAHFDADSRECSRKADESRAAGTSGTARDQAYNHAYGDCMKRRGYTEHAWVEHDVPGLP